MAKRRYNVQTTTIPAKRRNGGNERWSSIGSSGGISDLSNILERLSLKLDTEIFDDLFEKVNYGTEEDPKYAIRAKYGLYTNEFLSARGLNPNTGSSGSGSGVSWLSDLKDVTLKDLMAGQTIVWDGTKWVNRTLSAGLDESALNNYLNVNNYLKKQDLTTALESYATQQWVKDQHYLTDFTIYEATFKGGKFENVTYNPKTGAANINVPTHTSHLVNDSDFMTNKKFDELFEKVTVNGVTAIKAKFGFYSDFFVSSMGLNPDAGTTTPGKSYLCDLLDVSLPSNNSGVPTGSALVFNGTKWTASSIQQGLDESALGNYLTKNNYVTSSALGNYVTLDTAQTISGIKTFNARIDASIIQLRRSTSTSYGRISFYNSSYVTWFEYMTNAGTASPTGGNAPSGTYVTSWARRSLIESTSGYGWIWESCANSANAVPDIKMELSSNTGNLKVKGLFTAGGSITGTSFIKSGGTSSQFLKADGSVDSNAYVTTSSLGNYLPLSGGTMSNTNLVTNLNADLLDGVHLTGLFRMLTSNPDLNDLGDDNSQNGIFYVNTSSPSEGTPFKYGGILNLSNSAFSGQLAFSSTGDVQYRYRWWSANGNAWKDWHKIAFTDSNVASATQLQTTHTIWGQNFNGTQNVSGNMSYVGWIYGSTTSAPYLRMASSVPTDAGSLGTAIGFGGAPDNYGTFIWGEGSGNGHIQVGRKDGTNKAYNLCLQEFGGNVIIGATSSSYKLHVNGTLYASGATTLTSILTVSGLITANGGITIPTAKTLKIGECEITWDTEKGGLKFSKGIYSTDWVSAMGANNNAGETGGKNNLSDLLDVDVTSKSPRQYLMWNGSKWVASSVSWDDIANKPNVSTAWADITGKPTTLAGYGITDIVVGNSSSAKNCDDVTYNGLNYYKSGGPTTTIGATTADGALYSQAYSTSWVAQIAQDYRNGNLFVRGRNNGTWQEWKKMASISDLTWANIQNKPTTLSGYGITDALSVTTANASFVTALGTSGNSLTWTKNGTTNNITIPYATNAGNASALGGYGESRFFRDTIASLDPSGFPGNLPGNRSGSYSVTSAGWHGTAHVLYCQGSNSGLAFYRPGGSNSVPQLLCALDSTSNWTNYGTILTTGQGNAVSATRLQGSYSLWGQTFYGNNVSGDLANVGNIGTDTAPAGMIYANDWFRSMGDTGWYSYSYGGGIYMEDFTWIRTYNNKSFYCDSTIRADGELHVGSLGARFIVNTNGNVGIGVPNPMYKLHVQGNVGVGGVIYATTGIWSDGYISCRGKNDNSDINLKKDFKPLNLSLAEIAFAPSCTFKWKDNNDDDFGSIAQYWQKINPLFVRKNPKGNLTMPYGKIALTAVVSLAKKTNEHENRIQALEQDNVKLKEENKELKRKIEELQRA